MAASPAAVKLFRVPLEPLLDPADPRLFKADGTTPVRSWPIGVVASIFFNRSPGWLQKEIRIGNLVADQDVPSAAVVSGDRTGARRWTIAEVEQTAYALFHSDKHTYGTTELLRTLEVVYAVARLHGLLPSQ